MGDETRVDRAVVDVPDDLAEALGAPSLRGTFDAMSISHRREWVRAVLDAKRAETRAKRIAECVAAMRARASASRKR